jgi:hypothetical protein
MSHSKIIPFAGKNVRIDYSHLEKWMQKALISFLSVYPDGDPSARPDVHVSLKRHVSDDFNSHPIAINPQSHHEFQDGFGISIPLRGQIVWQKQADILVHMYLANFIRNRNILFKIFDREFNAPYQYIGEILHELILVPTALFFYENVLAIHGSAIVDKEGSVIVFSGTGGVGKTFLEMRFLLDNQYAFFSDDITLMGEEGVVYPNLAFPKIYKYNVSQLPALKRYIQERYGLLSRMQWVLYPAIPYMGKYCRRVLNPERISQIPIPEKGRLKHFYFLFRSKHVKRIECETLDAEKAWKSSYRIMRAEYHRMFTHIGYHEYNRTMCRLPEIVAERDVEKKYTEIFGRLKNVTFRLIHIPIEFKINDLYSFIENDLK